MKKLIILCIGAMFTNAANANCNNVQKSELSYEPAFITFKNESKKDALIFWINFKGERILYKTLKPSGILDQKTYSQHVFLITDNQKSCKDVVIVDENRKVIQIK